jgi:hypothetical protein
MVAGGRCQLATAAGLLSYCSSDESIRSHGWSLVDSHAWCWRHTNCRLEKVDEENEVEKKKKTEISVFYCAVLPELPSCHPQQLGDTALFLSPSSSEFVVLYHLEIRLRALFSEVSSDSIA